jgi:uridine kinase
MITHPAIIQESTPSTTVEIHLPDGRVLSGPRGTPVGDFLRKLPEWSKPQITGAVINGSLRELTYPIDIESIVRPVTMEDEDGSRIYRRSVTFLLEAAFEDLFPEADLSVDHSLSSGAYYCKVVDRAALSKAELERLEIHMREIVRANLKFERKIVPLQEAIEYFRSKGQTEKVQLLKYRQKDFLVLYQLKERRDYHHGYMVPSTGFLKHFALTLMGEGFALRFPRRISPDQLMPMPDSPKLLATFSQYGDWLYRLGIGSVGALNDAIQAGRIAEIILVSEALHELKIADIARQIVKRHKESRIVLIAGPSSSGKTTFSKRLSVQLLAQGVEPYPLEMDNYFVNRERTPRSINGKFDFEALEALDTSRLALDLQHLLAGEEVQLPHFNFKEGFSEPGEVVRLQRDQLVILEGIHGLDPRLLPSIPSKQTFRIYVSCLTQLNLDRHNRISTTDTRLLRRITRDAHERGYSALQTIGRWDSVTQGEKRNIFPFQENADELFNSALVYELTAIKPFVEPLLRQVPFGTPEYVEAKRLLAFLEWFLPINPDLIPDNSILREFIGGSILKNFKLWEGAPSNGLDHNIQAS